MNEGTTTTAQIIEAVSFTGEYYARLAVRIVRAYLPRRTS